jgi:hypothetical protein
MPVIIQDVPSIQIVYYTDTFPRGNKYYTQVLHSYNKMISGATMLSFEQAKQTILENVNSIGIKWSYLADAEIRVMVEETL